FAGKFTKAWDSIAFHLKVDDDLSRVLLCANADLVGIEVGTSEWGLVARIVLSVLGWIEGSTFGCRSCTGVPKLQFARSEQCVNCIRLVETGQIKGNTLVALAITQLADDRLINAQSAVNTSFNLVERVVDVGVYL